MQNSTAGTRLGSSSVALAQFASLRKWTPNIGDFVIWHGFFTRWYGVIGAIDGDVLHVIIEGLPKLLFTMLEAEYAKNTRKVSLSAMRSSMGGEYHVLQDGVWYIDE